MKYTSMLGKLCSLVGSICYSNQSVLTNTTRFYCAFTRVIQFRKKFSVNLGSERMRTSVRMECGIYWMLGEQRSKVGKMSQVVEVP